MTREGHNEGYQPTDRVRSEWGHMQQLDASHSNAPMRGSRRASYGDKPDELCNERAHEELGQATGSQEKKASQCWKHIIVCGDDFGMNSHIDAAMFQLAQLGRLNAISCLAQGPTFSTNGRQLREMDVDVGLHLNLTERLDHRDQLPVTPLATLITRTYAGYLQGLQLDEQIARQLDTFEQVMGRAPDYVDGHQHIHQLPGVLPRLLGALNKRYGAGHRPWLRYTAPGMQTGIPLNDSAKAHVIGALGSNSIARAAQQDGWHTNRRLLGVYGLQGGARYYAKLLHQWLSNARDGDLLMCHPAAIGACDKLAGQRAAEFNVLARAELGDWMRQNGMKMARPTWQ